ncbi:hypothetical protein GOV11_01355 [Candidatus Woesearchaeota archaeon]|nr:hypothetical protein [Candidatus Woesearchaeota archaeon]
MADNIKVDAFAYDAISDLIKNKKAQIAFITAELEAQTTRVANNRITENNGTDQAGVAVIGAAGNHLGITSYNIDDQDHFTSMKRALIIAEESPPMEWFKGFPPLKKEIIRRNMKTVSELDRTHAIAEACKMSKDAGYLLSGAIVSNKINVEIKTSTTPQPNLDKIVWMGSQLYCTITATNSDNTIEAKAGSVGTTVKNLGLDKMVNECLESMRFQESLPLVNLPPGKYDAALAAPCSSHILLFLSWYGLNGGFHKRGGTISSDLEMGDKLLGKNISVRDNPQDPRSPIWIPADLMGVPREKTVFVEDGNLKSLWYDFWSAQKYDQPATGHGYTVSFGPTHLELSPGMGPNTLKQAAKEIGNGIVVSSFNYTRLSGWKDCSFTGMTRAGTYLVENGEIIARTPNLRFNDSVPHMLSDDTWLSKKQEVCLPPEVTDVGPVQLFYTPKFIGVKGFNVTGATPISPE